MLALMAILLSLGLLIVHQVIVRPETMRSYLRIAARGFTYGLAQGLAFGISAVIVCVLLGRLLAWLAMGMHL